MDASELPAIYNAERSRAVTQGLKKRGVNSVMSSVNGAPNELMVIDPRNVRSRHAAFDPFRRHENNLLAGIGAGALALPALNEAVDESKFADGGLAGYDVGGSVDYEAEAERQRRRALAGRGRMPDIASMPRPYRAPGMGEHLSYTAPDQTRMMSEIAAGLRAAPGAIGNAFINMGQQGLQAQDRFERGVTEEGDDITQMPFASLTEPSRLGFASSFISENLTPGGLLGIPSGGMVLGAGPVRRTGRRPIAEIAQDVAPIGHNGGPALDAVTPRPMPSVAVAKDLPELTGLAADYPRVIPPVPTIDKKSGKEYLAKTLSDEALAFKQNRDAIRAGMDEGYTPYFQPADRFDVDPSKYPAIGDSSSLLMKKPETRAKWDAETGNAGARERLSSAYERGLLQREGSGDWYFMGQLEKEFINEYGADAGRKLFKERFPDAMAATTGGADPTANLLMAHYGNFIRNKGNMVPTEGFNIPYPVGGRYVGGNMKQFNKMIASPDASGITLANPKRYNFSGNFVGNSRNPTIDEQMTTIIAGPRKASDKLDAPSASNYGHFERPVAELAADYGVTPRYFQEVGWAGGKDAITKGGYQARPMISHVNDAVQRTALLTGMTPKEVVRRALVRAEMPLYADGGKAEAAPTDTLARIEALLA